MIVSPQPPIPPLSPQEIAVLRALADGCQSKEIAAVLARSKPTVEATVRLLCVKLNARSRAQLVAKAIGYGIIEIRTPLVEDRDSSVLRGALSDQLVPEPDC